MPRFTYIIEFRGGTFINQVVSNDLLSSLKDWGDLLFTAEIKHLGKKSKIKILAQIPEEIPTPLFGLKAVWFAHFKTDVGALFVNIVG